MEQDIIKDLFSKCSFYIVADSTPWTSEWADGLVDFYEGTNLANNINDVEFDDDISVSVDERTIRVVLCCSGNDGENELDVALSAYVCSDFETLSDFDYDEEIGDPIDHDYDEDDNEDEDDEDEEEEEE